MPRYKYIDLARGFALLVVIVWHILGEHTPWTDGWVMPIWFFIMGLFYKHHPSLKYILMKKFNGLIIPVLFYSIPAFVIKIFDSGIYETLLEIVNPYRCINGPSWFLWCTFWCYMIFYGLHRFSGCKKLSVGILSLGISLIGYYMPFMQIEGHKVVLPLFFSTAMTAQVFLFLGEQLRSFVLSDTKWYYAFCSVVLAIAGILWIEPKPSEWIWDSYGDSFLAIVFNGLFGSLAIINICRIIPSQIGFVGKHSLLILLIHMYVTMVLKGFLSGWFLYFAVVLISCVIAGCCVRYFPRFSGQQPLLTIDQIKHIV